MHTVVTVADSTTDLYSNLNFGYKKILWAYLLGKLVT